MPMVIVEVALDLEGERAMPDDYDLGWLEACLQGELGGLRFTPKLHVTDVEVMAVRELVFFRNTLELTRAWNTTGRGPKWRVV